jgi:hypothetical protein
LWERAEPIGASPHKGAGSSATAPIKSGKQAKAYRRDKPVQANLERKAAKDGNHRRA